MIIKVCGIKTEENIQFLAEADIDMIGLNFYKPSVRYIAEGINPEIFNVLPQDVKRVGVFVNESIPAILGIASKFSLDYIQLHGDETPDFCYEISRQFSVIKVFRIDEHFDFDLIKKYESSAYYLFDTKTNKYGGSGQKFDWAILKKYKINTPFLLSGGIGVDDIDRILEVQHPHFAGIDINSKFENTPGIKDKNLVLPFIKKLKFK